MKCGGVFAALRMTGLKQHRERYKAIGKTRRLTFALTSIVKMPKPTRGTV
jgi:hypothetical protein